MVRKWTLIPFWLLSCLAACSQSVPEDTRPILERPEPRALLSGIKRFSEEGNLLDIASVEQAFGVVLMPQYRENNCDHYSMKHNGMCMYYILASGYSKEKFVILYDNYALQTGRPRSTLTIQLMHRQLCITEADVRDVWGRGVDVINYRGVIFDAVDQEYIRGADIGMMMNKDGKNRTKIDFFRFRCATDIEIENNQIW